MVLLRDYAFFEEKWIARMEVQVSSAIIFTLVNKIFDDTASENSSNFPEENKNNACR